MNEGRDVIGLRRRSNILTQYLRRVLYTSFSYVGRNLPRGLAKYLSASRVAPLLRRVRRAAHIYPINIPRISIQSDLDLLVLELPPRYIPMMPNGIGYVHNILKKCGIVFQTVDLNIDIYHRFHSARILGGTPVVLSSGYVVSDDPWDNIRTDEWERSDVVDYFLGMLGEVARDIIRKRPRAVGISVQGNNRKLANQFIQLLREEAAETIIVVGGYDCKYHDIGPYLVPDCDYMAIGDTELTLEALVTALARGERPGDLPGFLSRFDSPNRVWMPTPELAELDRIEFPRYEWTDPSLYRTYYGQYLVPITSTRGCSWSKCRFCGECFTFRKRSPKDVADEIEFWIRKQDFPPVLHFNDSDLNGDHQYLYDVCSAIIERKLDANIAAQLRISKHNTREYFEHLRRAGFRNLRFGVDAWSKNVLRLQKKSNNMQHVFQNLRDCHNAGIRTAVNIVLGVPGETEADIDETIQNLILCRDYIDLVENINTIILAGGSEYYNNPDEYKIRFHGEKEEIYRNHRYVIPNDLWYSEDPYIDQPVRLRRLDRICEELHERGINIGRFAERAVRNLMGGGVA
ncbi:MAG: radical SAM protein [Deltaproteobacteria bacterium]|nr:radical SAM protein [Deltaproteobacteria bacterium]